MGSKAALAPVLMQVYWHGNNKEGHPVLLVHLARLCNVCQSHEQAQQAADAVISQACHAPSYTLSKYPSHNLCHHCCGIAGL